MLLAIFLENITKTMYTFYRIFLKGVLHIMDLNSTFITILNYDLSYLEFLVTLSGILNVYLLAKIKVSNYFWGIINVILSLFICYNVRMYSTMALQLYYLIMNIYGLWTWTRNSDTDDELKITANSKIYNLKALVISFFCFIALGFFLNNIHTVLPMLFREPESSPFVDSFITTLNIVAMYFMANKKIDHWYLWFIADFVSAIVFFVKDVKFVALQYLVFLFFAILGYIEWKKELEKA